MKFVKKNSFSKIVLACTIPVLLLTSSCVRYQAEPLKSLTYVKGFETKASLSMVYKVLDREEQMKYLGRKFSDRAFNAAKAFTPVQVTIANLTPHIYKLPDDAFDLDVVPVSDVYSDVKTSTAGRFLLVGVPSYVAGAYCGAIALVVTVFGAPIVGAFLVSAALASFMLGTSVVISSANSNAALEKDYAAKALENGNILPNTVVNGVIFVKRGTFHDKFSVKFIKEPTGVLTTIEALPAASYAKHM